MANLIILGGGTYIYIYIYIKFSYYNNNINDLMFLDLNEKKIIIIKIIIIIQKIIKDTYIYIEY
jgi:hypothetical protein